MVGQRQEKVILAIDEDDLKEKILYDDKDYEVSFKEFANAGHLSKRLLEIQLQTSTQLPLEAHVPSHDQSWIQPHQQNYRNSGCKNDEKTMLPKYLKNATTKFSTTQNVTLQISALIYQYEQKRSFENHRKLFGITTNKLQSLQNSHPRALRHSPKFVHLPAFHQLIVLAAVHRTLKNSRYAPAYNLFVANRALVTEIFVLLLVGLTYTIGFILSKRFATREIAVGNAHKIVTAERHLNIFLELDFQHAVLAVVSDTFMRFMNNFYLFAHLPCSISFLLWVFFYHKKQYYRFRNSFLFGHCVCILVEILFPCAPPRMLSELGFVDTMMVYSKADLMTWEEAAGVNPYAAMPSMHFGYAFLVGAWGFALSKKLMHKTLFITYTCMVFFGVVVTGNHFIADCLAALVVNVAAYVVVSNWEHATKIVKHAASSVTISTRPNYFWLYILIIFGGFATIIHLSLRAMAFQMQLN